MRCFRAVIFSVACLLFASGTPAQSTREVGPLPFRLSQTPGASLEALHAVPPRAAPRRRLHPSFFSGLRKPPLTPAAVAFRESVAALSGNPHRFVRCRLTDGKILVGGVTYADDAGFYLSDGISGRKWIAYSSLSAAPEPVAAVGPHLANAAKWTAIVILAIPVAIVLLPFTGLLND